MNDGFDVERWVATWRGPLVGLLAGRGASSAEAEELARDVFAEAWLARSRFHGDPNDVRAVGRRLGGIARNLHRARRRRAVRYVGLDDTEPRGSSPEGEANEELRALAAAIDALPARDREVVHAFYLEETSTACVAALLGCTERAVEGRLRRARARLRAALRAVAAPRADA